MKVIKGGIIVETVDNAKPDVTITMPWDEAVKVSEVLGRSSAGDTFRVYDALSDIVDPRYNRDR